MPDHYPGFPDPSESEAHRLSFWANDRQIMTCTKYAQDAEVLLPQALGNVTPTAVTDHRGVRFGVRYQRQTEYDGDIHVLFGSGLNVFQERQLRLHLTKEYLGSIGTLDITTPDFHGLPGWQADWGFRPNARVEFSFEAKGWSLPGTASRGDAACGEDDFLSRPEVSAASQLRAAWYTSTLWTPQLPGN
jgi:hypothetical protein